MRPGHRARDLVTAALRGVRRHWHFQVAAWRAQPLPFGHTPKSKTGSSNPGTRGTAGMVPCAGFRGAFAGGGSIPPLVAAILARDEDGHGLISRSRLLLVEGAITLLALAALEHVAAGPQVRGCDVHLLLERGFLKVCRLLHHLLFAGHLGGVEGGDSLRADLTTAHLGPKVRVLGVGEVEFKTLHHIRVLLVAALEVLEQFLFDLTCQALLLRLVHLRAG
mmetsp:Transcript_28689/g.58694  ORF Transcript_28689/g.58694 Transcript_28689/m.58694 type:complete len:221 (-) Transcript_28689:79-741(-)